MHTDSPNSLDLLNTNCLKQYVKLIYKNVFQRFETEVIKKIKILTLIKV